MSDGRRIITPEPGDGALMFRAGGGPEIEYPLVNPGEVAESHVLGQVTLGVLFWSEAGEAARRYLWESVLPLLEEDAPTGRG